MSNFINLGINTEQALSGLTELVGAINGFSRNFNQGMGAASTSGNRLTRVLDSMNNELNETRSCMDRTSQAAHSFFSKALSLLPSINLSAEFSKITAAVKETEQAVSKLTAVTGDLNSAKILFEELNDLANQIPQSFDDITASAINLNKGGIEPTNNTLKSLAAIAVGTNQSLSSVAQSVTKAVMWQYGGLQQLGIKAVEEGNKIKVTFRGVTEQIGKDSKSIINYIERISATNFSETLEYQMQGLTGAMIQFDNAWGDLYNAIGQSGVGDAIGDIVREATRAINSLVDFLKNPKVVFAIQEFARLFIDSFNNIISGVGKLWKPFSDFLSSLDSSTDAECELCIGYFEGWFDFVRLGLNDLVSWIGKMWLCYGIVLILESTKYIIKFLGLKINFFNFRNINTL